MAEGIQAPLVHDQLTAPRLVSAWISAEPSAHFSQTAPPSAGSHHGVRYLASAIQLQMPGAPAGIAFRHGRLRGLESRFNSGRGWSFMATAFICTARMHGPFWAAQLAARQTAAVGRADRPRNAMLPRQD